MAGSGPVRIGYCLSLSGPLAGNSRSARLAHEIWRDDVNAQGGLLGRTVKLVCHDDGADASRVPELYRQLIDVDHVELVIGGNGTNTLLPAMPLLMIAADRMLRAEPSMDGVDAAHDLKGRILVIGFGRFGQIASQALLSKGIDLSVIDTDPDRIRDAARYGFKVFFGDGTRLDVLRHSGAGEAGAIMICIDDPKAALQIVELAQHEFPQARLLVRSYDRDHAVELIRAGVDYQIRETVESAYQMGEEGLRTLGFAEVDIEEAAEDTRRRDTARLAEQVQGDAMSGRDRLHIQSA